MGSAQRPKGVMSPSGVPLGRLPWTLFVRHPVAQPGRHHHLNALAKQLAERPGDDENVCSLEERHDALEKPGHMTVVPDYLLVVLKGPASIS